MKIFMNLSDVNKYMSLKLIVYNYSTELGQKTIFEYINNLLCDLKNNDVDVSSIEKISGNAKYPKTCTLIKEILKHWGNIEKGKLPIRGLYHSFLFLSNYISDTQSKDKQCPLMIDSSHIDLDEKKIKSDLVAILEKEFPIEKRAFFSSIIVTGKDYVLESPYGVFYSPHRNCRDGICLIANIDEKAVWHETAHLLGAEDHYDPDTKEPNSLCKNPDKCLMQYDKLDGYFCCASIKEIRQFVDKHIAG